MKNLQEAAVFHTEMPKHIELDGSQHYEEKGLTYDDERNRFLEEHGIRVIHIANNQIHTNFRNVCEYIDMLVKGEL